MPTYSLPDGAYAEYVKLSRDQRRAFRRALARFIEALRQDPPRFPTGLRVKGVQGNPGVWELSFAPDGRATFKYGEELSPGEPPSSGVGSATTRSSATRRPGASGHGPGDAVLS